MEGGAERSKCQFILFFNHFLFQLTDDVEKSRSTFEALNSQLLEELPKLLEVSTSIFNDSVSEFVLLRKIFVGKVTKELLSLMDVSLFSID
jgi:hypothetical protein